jgi:hypothetical protein
VEVQIPFGLLESLEDVREGFFSLCVSAGRQVLSAMVELMRAWKIVSPSAGGI